VRPVSSASSLALRRIGAEVLEVSSNRVASAEAHAEAAGTALTRAQSAREEAQSLHDLLERRRALIEEKERLAERAEQEADDARRLQDAERASRVRPYLVAEQAARRRAQQAVAALAARADQSGLAHLAEQAGVTSADSAEEATGSEADSHGAAVTPAALVEPLVREAQRQLTALEDQPSEAMAGDAEAGAAPQNSDAAETPVAADESETERAEALSPRGLDDLAHRCRREHGQLEALVDLEADLPARESALQQREAELQRAAGQLEQRAEKLAERPAQRTALVETLEAARAAHERLEGLQERRSRAEERHRAALAVEQLSAQLAQRDDSCAEAAVLAQEATERVRATRLAWISGTAGALAGEAREDLDDVGGVLEGRRRGGAGECQGVGQGQAALGPLTGLQDHGVPTGGDHLPGEVVHEPTSEPGPGRGGRLTEGGLHHLVTEPAARVDTGGNPLGQAPPGRGEL